mmetsp:Transcript_37932/g.108359  ORF Transcript_37932/g.108359 Transcript_37932/m.108359 type:complete len:232 (-) Transcript_37932:515-1210(-)
MAKLEFSITSWAENIWCSRSVSSAFSTWFSCSMKATAYCLTAIRSGLAFCTASPNLCASTTTIWLSWHAWRSPRCSHGVQSTASVTQWPSSTISGEPALELEQRLLRPAKAESLLLESEDLEPTEFWLIHLSGVWVASTLISPRVYSSRPLLRNVILSALAPQVKATSPFASAEADTARLNARVRSSQALKKGCTDRCTAKVSYFISSRRGSDRSASRFTSFSWTRCFWRL